MSSDLTERLTKYTESGSSHSFSQTYSYDSSNRLASSSEVTQGTTRSITYTYDDDNRITAYKKAALSLAQGTVLCVDTEPSFCYNELGDKLCQDKLALKA